MIIRIHISTIHKIQTTSMKRSMRNKRHTFDSSFRSKQHRVAPILDALISLNPGRTSNSINRISRVIGKHWSIIVWSSIEQTTIVRNEKRKKEKYRMILDTVLQWSIVSTVRTCYTHWTHSNEVCFSNGFSLPRPYTHKVHFPRMYLARLPFELRDGISSIYIYTYTRNKSLAPFMTFLHRSIDRLYRAPIYRVDVQNETSYTVVWWMILRGWKWKHSLWRRELVIQPFLREMKVTRQIFLPVTGWK